MSAAEITRPPGGRKADAISDIQTSLPVLAQQINAEHDRAKAAFSKGFEHALRAGELLLEAKAQSKHGQWLPWLKEHCTVPERTAQLYMKVAKGLPELKAKNASLADLTLEGAARQLSKPKPPTVGNRRDRLLAFVAKEFPDASIDEIVSDLTTVAVTVEKPNPKTHKEWADEINATAREAAIASGKAADSFERAKNEAARHGYHLHIEPPEPFAEFYGNPTSTDEFIAALRSLHGEIIGGAP